MSPEIIHAAAPAVVPVARRRGPKGRREVLVDGRWLPEADVTPEAITRPVVTNGAGPITRRQGEAEAGALARVPGVAGGIDLSRYRGTPRKEEEPMPEPGTPSERQRRLWNAYHEHGGQGAASRALGVTQGNLRSGILGYMRARGIPEPIPPADRSLIDGESLSVVPAEPAPTSEPAVSLDPEPEPASELVAAPRFPDPHDGRHIDCSECEMPDPTPAETAGARLVLEQLLDMATAEVADAVEGDGVARSAVREQVAVRRWLKARLADLA